MPRVIPRAYDFRHTDRRAGDPYNSAVKASSLLMSAGFLVWALVGTRVVANAVAPGAGVAALVDVIAWLAFLAAFLTHVRSENRRSLGIACLALQTAAALRLGHSAGTGGMEVALLVMVAGQLPTQFSASAAFAWVVAQTAAGAVLQIFLSPEDRGLSALGAVLYFGGYTAFQLFALGAASLAESEHTARVQLAEANAELERMHALAIAGARQAERLRIARDLHDSLGHRLTALGLALEAARHLPADGMAPKVAEARGLASELIADLRRAVGEIRDDETPELRSLFDGLARSVDKPRVSTDIESALRITSPDATTALYRIGQEIVTNAARHSDATRVTLTLRSVGDDVEIEGIDDGSRVGPNGVTPGNGLTGIRERARLLGGDATFGPVEGRGFRVLARFPAARLA